MSEAENTCRGRVCGPGSMGLSGSEKGRCKMVDFSLSRDGEKMEIDLKNGCIDK